ncbi:MAG TPA: DUF4838 domain-containing protein, partial [Candidatus Hydrogenedentes bacterium]|nr:DUF4838 domain-containing protein [Candidatus Hydrogenedentota bacterium]
MTRAIIALAVALAEAVLAQPLSRGWATMGDFGNFHAVIPPDATESEELAASVFQRYWRESTSHELTIGVENTGKINVWLGRSALAVNLVEHKELEPLGPEGFLIRTYTPTRREKMMGAHKQLVIAALTDAGALHGVHEFLERFVNVRWLAPSATVASRAAFVINEIELPFRPSFEMRRSGYTPFWKADPNEYVHAHKLEGPPPRAALGEGALFALLPPDRHFKDHPEYYAEIAGKRTVKLFEEGGPRIADATQLCYANPAVADAIIAKLLPLLEAAPEALDPAQRALRDIVLADGEPHVITLSPTPWPGACECPLCRAVQDREGSPAGPLLILLNRVAEAIDQASPEKDYRIEALFTGTRRRPPASLRPRSNVNVWLRTDGCDMRRPLTDAMSPVNAAFARDLKGWAAITDNLYVWDYASNQDNPLRPHPDPHVFRENFLLYDQCRARGVYTQARQPGGEAPSELDALRAYVLSRALWDPDFPWEQARDDFIPRYYGSPGAAVRDALAMLDARARAANVYLHPFKGMSWLDYDTVAAINARFDNALA